MILVTYLKRSLKENYVIHLNDMLPLYLDINPNHDASTILIKEQTKYRIKANPSHDLVNIEEFMTGNLISIFTNLNISNQRPLEHIKESSSMDDDFDIISKFKFKSKKRIRARIKKSEFSPSMQYPWVFNHKVKCF